MADDNIMELDESNFDEVTGRDGVVVVDFWAEWCGPCKMFAPIFDAAAAANPDVTFAKVDTDAHTTIAARAGIQSIPTLKVYRDGELVASRSGAMGRAALDELIASARN